MADLFKPADDPVELLSSNERLKASNGWHSKWVVGKAEADLDSVPGLPPHRLLLKVGMPVMLLANDASEGFWNGSIGLVSSFEADDKEVVAVHCTLMHGSGAGKAVRVKRTTSYGRFPDVVREKMGHEYGRRRRVQFPIRPTFAMSISRARGMTLQAGAICLIDAVWAHGDLYTAISRFSAWAGVRILASSHCSPAEPAASFTPNIVHAALLATGSEADIPSNARRHPGYIDKYSDYLALQAAAEAERQNNFFLEFFGHPIYPDCDQGLDMPEKTRKKGPKQKKKNKKKQGKKSKK